MFRVSAKLQRSRFATLTQADAISKARKALAADYDLTSETIGLFYAESVQQGDTWTVTFHADGFNPTLLGGYTVTFTPGKDPKTS